MHEIHKTLTRIAEALEKQTKLTEDLSGNVLGVNFALQELANVVSGLAVPEAIYDYFAEKTRQGGRK